MLEGRDAGRSHSKQDFAIRDRWFWKIYGLQPFLSDVLRFGRRVAISTLASKKA